MVWIRATSWRLRSPCSRSQTAFSPFRAFPADASGMGRDHLLVENASTSGAVKFFGCGPRGLPALGFLKTAMHRRLAAADLAIARCLGDGAPAILADTRQTDAKRRSDGFRVSLWVPCHTIDSAGNLRAR